MYGKNEQPAQRRISVPTPLGKRVRELRLKRKLTLEGLADRVGSGTENPDGSVAALGQSALQVGDDGPVALSDVSAYGSK